MAPPLLPETPVPSTEQLLVSGSKENIPLLSMSAGGSATHYDAVASEAVPCAVPFDYYTRNYRRSWWERPWKDTVGGNILLYTIGALEMVGLETLFAVVTTAIGGAILDKESVHAALSSAALGGTILTAGVLAVTLPVIHCSRHKELNAKRCAAATTIPIAIGSAPLGAAILSAAGYTDITDPLRAFEFSSIGGVIMGAVGAGCILGSVPFSEVRRLCGLKADSEETGLGL